MISRFVVVLGALFATYASLSAQSSGRIVYGRTSLPLRRLLRTRMSMD